MSLGNLWQHQQQMLWLVVPLVPAGSSLRGGPY
jgi:hypothetical protein